MSSLYITHYYVRGTDPWKNIMLLPEEEAFRKASELASAHEGMTSYGRFADFKNYYPLRKAADKQVREQFVGLGGKPRLEHPYSFVLGESDYLKTWFDEGDCLRIPLDEIPDELILCLLALRDSRKEEAGHRKTIADRSGKRNI